MKSNYWCIQNDLHELVPPWEGVLRVEKRIFESDRVLYPVKNQGFRRLVLLNWTGTGTPKLYESEEKAQTVYIQAKIKKIEEILANVLLDCKALRKLMV